MSLPKTLQKLINNVGYGQTLTGNDNDIVHKSGNEEIHGRKLFVSHQTYDSETGWDLASRFMLKTDDITRGVPVTENTYFSFDFQDSTYDVNNDLGGNNPKLASLEYVKYKSGMYLQRLLLVNESSLSENCSLALAYDENNIPCATAPSTSNQRSYGADILTRDWIPKDTRIVHTTGAEEISGDKYFKGHIFTDDWITCKHTTNRFNTTTNNFRDVQFMSNDDQRMSGIEGAMRPNSTDIKMYVNANDTEIEPYGWLLVTCGLNSTSRCFYSPYSSTVSGTRKATDLGLADARWANIYSQSNVNVSSDRRIKDLISNIPDEVLDAWENVNFVQFKIKNSINMKGTDSARLHNGLIAQDLLTTFNEKNIDISKYGLFCHDAWEAKEAVLDEDGNVKEPAKEAGDEYSIRYEEALCMEAAYQRRRADRAEARIATLEEEVSSLKSQFSQLLNSAAG